MGQRAKTVRTQEEDVCDSPELLEQISREEGDEGVLGRFDLYNKAHIRAILWCVCVGNVPGYLGIPSLEPCACRLDDR